MTSVDWRRAVPEAGRRIDGVRRHTCIGSMCVNVHKRQYVVYLPSSLGCYGRCRGGKLVRQCRGRVLIGRWQVMARHRRHEIQFRTAMRALLWCASEWRASTPMYWRHIARSDETVTGNDMCRYEKGS